MFLYRPTRREPAALRILGDAVDVTLTVLAGMLLIVMCANVAARAALNTDIAWNTEFGEFVLLWATFLGGAAASRRSAHMQISEFVWAMPKRLRYVIELATRAAVVVILGFLVLRGLDLVDSTMEQRMTVLNWPVGIQYLAMPVGSALTLVFVVYEAILVAARIEIVPESPLE
jgi:TRAP-type C4-dicarboxylate transport system permease small subunit